MHMWFSNIAVRFYCIFYSIECVDEKRIFFKKDLFIIFSVYVKIYSLFSAYLCILR